MSWHSSFPSSRPDASTPSGRPHPSQDALVRVDSSPCSHPGTATGLLLVVEDIHWADTSSRELLDYISRRVRGLRVMVGVTYRDDELHRRHPLVPQPEPRDSLYLKKAHSLGHLRQEADLLGFAQLVNSITLARHRARERLKQAA
jgi:hypothetical protein